MPTTVSISGRRLDWLLRLLLVGAVVAVFWPVLQAGFVDWDDEVNIVNNPHLGFSWENIRWMFTDTSYVRRYLPLGWLSYTVDRVFFGGSPTSYHAGNLLLHAANTLLLYAILKQVLQLVAGDVKRRTFIGSWDANPPPGGGCDCRTHMDDESPSLRFGAAAGALWWAMNPLRAEPVAWASSRIYCAAALFFFLAVLAYLRQADRSLSSERRRWMLWTAAFCFGLSLFTYPVALGGLAVFVVLDFVPLRRLPPNPREWGLPTNRRIWAEKLLFLIPVVIMFGVNFSARLNHPDVQAVVTFAQFSAGARVFQGFWIWGWYVWKPWQPFDLAPKYPGLLTDLPFTTAHLAAALLVVAITVLLLLRRRVWPGLLALWLCHLALLAPLTGVTEHPHHAFDRYSYIVGGIWALVIAGTFLRLMGHQRVRIPIVTATALICCFFGWLAHQQTLIWGNSLSLQVRMAESLGNHPLRASHDVVVATLLLAESRPAEAAATLRCALALQPGLPEAWGAFGDALAGQNRLDTAIASYQRALALNPQLDAARQNLAVTLAMAGHQQEAVGQFTELLHRNPKNASVHYNLALSLDKLNRKAEAQQHLEEFRRLQKENGSAKLQ